MFLVIFLFVSSFSPAFAQQGDALSLYSSKDEPLTTDPGSPFWKGVPAVVADHDNQGRPVPGNRTEIRSRWTEANLYFLFSCPFESLYLKPSPTTSSETNRLWLWDVAEIFIGADFAQIWRYREFQVSPQGEWVDLDIDRNNPLPEGGWRWNSGFSTAARIDRAGHVWYGAFRIARNAINGPRGDRYRVNFYRFQGGPEPRQLAAWRPTGNTNHTPEKFGILKLVRR